MKIGLLGGSFDPIHLGHLILAEEIKGKLSLDRVIFIPANITPHKQDKNFLPSSMRFKMVKWAISGNNSFLVSDLEIKRGGISYSIDTVKYFRQKYQQDELFFIVGSDAVAYLNDWRDIDEIYKIAKFVMAARPGYDFKDIDKRIIQVYINGLDISAFEIRERLKSNLSIRYLVPDKVRNFIIKKRLYAKEN
ncbi:MAG: nicotinate-nucleotide adenylyltransferase [Candidatus Omnitrophota bacterium]